MAVTVICVGISGAVPKQIKIDLNAGVTVPLGKLLLENLRSAGGPNLGHIILNDVVQEGYVILLNGRNSTQLEGLATLVEDESSIVITTPVVGG